MSHFNPALLAASILVAVLVVLAWLWHSKRWLPDELKTAKLAFIEKTFRTESPFRIVGRVDRVYRMHGNVYVPLEYKNRDNDRIYETDIAQISLQGWLLRRHGMKTAEYGYVGIKNRKTRKRAAIKVSLRDDAFCEKLITRHLSLTERRVEPRKSYGNKCKTCGHKAACLS